jgi:hypothetical protein
LEIDPAPIRGTQRARNSKIGRKNRFCFYICRGENVAIIDHFSITTSIGSEDTIFPSTNFAGTGIREHNVKGRPLTKQSGMGTLPLSDPTEPTLSPHRVGELVRDYLAVWDVLFSEPVILTNYSYLSDSDRNE